jgi:hypothetical protein
MMPNDSALSRVCWLGFTASWLVTSAVEPAWSWRLPNNVVDWREPSKSHRNDDLRTNPDKLHHGFYDDVCLPCLLYSKNAMGKILRWK